MPSSSPNHALSNQSTSGQSQSGATVPLNWVNNEWPVPGGVPDLLPLLYALIPQAEDVVGEFLLASEVGVLLLPKPVANLCSYQLSHKD
jgi:hypothetical protein